MNRLGVVAVLLLLPVSACGSPKDEPRAVPTDATSSAPVPDDESTSASGDSVNESEPVGPVEDVLAVAAVLEDSLPDVAASIELTEDNDANDLIGRPGQYDAAVFLALESLGCTGHNYDDLSIDCGIKLERWPSGEDAAARAQDIQTKLKTYGLGAEWDYGVGRILLRIAGDVPPSQATTIRDAFAMAAGDEPIDLAN